MSLLDCVALCTRNDARLFDIAEQKIIGHPNYTSGQTVTLASCNVGAGKNSVAQQLVYKFDQRLTTSDQRPIQASRESLVASHLPPCTFAATPRGTLANELARTTGVKTTVKAPDTLLNYSPDGQIKPQSPGKWRTFKGKPSSPAGRRCLLPLVVPPM